MRIESLSYMYPNELYHHGIKGMKWGVRRFQNEDGSLTSAGERRYGLGDKIKGKFSDMKAKSAENKARRERVKEIRKERGRLTNKYNEKHRLTKDIENAREWKEAYEEEDDRREDAEYYRGKENALREVRDAEVRTKVNKRLLEKYGQQRMDEVRKSDEFREGAKTAAMAVAAIGALAFSLKNP